MKTQQRKYLPYTLLSHFMTVIAKFCAKKPSKCVGKHFPGAGCAFHFLETFSTRRKCLKKGELCRKVDEKLNHEKHTRVNSSEFATSLRQAKAPFHWHRFVIHVLRSEVKCVSLSNLFLLCSINSIKSINYFTGHNDFEIIASR